MLSLCLEGRSITLEGSNGCRSWPALDCVLLVRADATGSDGMTSMAWDIWLNGFADGVLFMVVLWALLTWLFP